MAKRIREAVAVSALCAALGAAAVPWVSAASEKSQSLAQPVDRVVLQWKDGTFEVAARVPLVKVLLPMDSLPPGGVASGFWVELQTADGQVRYRRVLTDPTRLVHEGPSGTGTGETKVDRAEAPVLERTFSVLVPRANPGDQLLLFGPPPGGRKRSVEQASHAIARLALVPPPGDAKPAKKGGAK